MDHFQPVLNIDPSELPKGFSTSDPTGRNASNGGDASSSAAAEKQQQEEQKQNILEQVLEPEALARLRRIKPVKFLEEIGYEPPQGRLEQVLDNTDTDDNRMKFRKSY